jgi:hypothetical protein
MNFNVELPAVGPSDTIPTDGLKGSALDVVNNPFLEQKRVALTGYTTSVSPENDLNSTSAEGASGLSNILPNFQV